jgi:hypothetical protein
VESNGWFSAIKLIVRISGPGQLLPYTASTKPPSGRPLHFETCRMNEVAGDVIELKVGADETTALQGGRAIKALLAVADGRTADGHAGRLSAMRPKLP